jgi:hypothetical protein
MFHVEHGISLTGVANVGTLKPALAQREPERSSVASRTPAMGTVTCGHTAPTQLRPLQDAERPTNADSAIVAADQAHAALPKETSAQRGNTRDPSNVERPLPTAAIELGWAKRSPALGFTNSGRVGGRAADERPAYEAQTWTPRKWSPSSGALSRAPDSTSVPRSKWAERPRVAISAD